MYKTSIINNMTKIAQTKCLMREGPTTFAVLEANYYYQGKQTEK